MTYEAMEHSYDLTDRSQYYIPEEYKGTYMSLHNFINNIDTIKRKPLTCQVN